MVMQFNESNKHTYGPRKGVKGRRPTKLSPEMVREVEVLSGRGLTQKQIAEYFGMCVKTFYCISERDPDVRIAYSKGKAKTISFVAGKLIEQVKMGDVRSMIFYLKTQAGWKYADNYQCDHHDGDYDNNTLELGTRDPNEASRTYQQIMMRGRR